MKTFKLIAIILLITTSSIFAQNALIRKIYKYIDQGNYNEALKLAKKGIKKYPKTPDFYVLAAQVAKDIEPQKITAINYLKTYFNLTKDYKAFTEIGLIFMQLKQYDSAAVYFKKYLNSKYSEYIEHLYLTAKFRDSALKHPINFNPTPLPLSVNSSYDEYFPDISAFNTLYFTRKIQDENIYFSQKIDNAWTPAQPLPNYINTPEQEGAVSISADGKIMIFTRCTMLAGCDLFITYKTNKGWSQPKRLPYPINTKYWESQPCIANNGKTIYFVSNRPGGYGQMDIYVAKRKNGKWVVQNLGPNINTKGKEMSPFLHFDQQTLYFSSDYHPGMGGFDLFMAKKTPNGFSKPINLGYPLNSEEDEVRLIVNAKADTAYFASSKSGNFDIYLFKIPKKIRPKPTIFIDLKIIDKFTKKPITANITLTNLDSDSTIFKTYTSNAFISAPIANYALFVEKQNYLFASKHFSTTDTANNHYIFHITVPLTPIQQGQSIILNNIFFEFNSYKLKPQSYPELNKLVQFLKQNPNIQIEIQGHTDSIGSFEYNIWLSQKRAEAVKQYLIQKGIDPNRLIAKGYGFTHPIAPNSTEKGRKLNRRVEIKIIKL